MREIGSEFWDVPQSQNCNQIFPKSTQWFLAGRSALHAIISELKGCHTVAMPSWCCDSMVKPFVDAGMEVYFYPVYWKNGLIQEIDLDRDLLFIMDYFGYVGSQPDLRDYKGTIIRDVTHSIFSTNHVDADYYFGSLRKWCGVWTGGYAWSKDGHKLKYDNFADDCGYTNLRKKAMQLKREYINNQYVVGGVMNKTYLSVFNEAEDLLENIGIVSAAERDVQAAVTLNVEYIKSRRKSNAEVLRNAFPNWIMFPEMKEQDCPMFVPVLVPNGRRDELRKYLIENGIYCPIHWPMSEYHTDKKCMLNQGVESIYENELSLVCDHRYTEEDMIRVADTIRAFWLEG